MVSFTIRTAQVEDLTELTDMLADSFHKQDSMGQWMYSLWRLGIYEDLRHRLRDSSSRYACLVAVGEANQPYPASPTVSNPNLTNSTVTNYAVPPAQPISQRSAGTAPTAKLNDSLPNSSTDVLIGTVELSLRSGDLWDWFTPNRPYLANLAVSRHYRRHGIAGQLLVRCEAIARDWGFREIGLHVMQDNKPAYYLYRKLGYRVEGADPLWLSRLWGYPRRLFLKKVL